jgi:hypothetical protein
MKYLLFILSLLFCIVSLVKIANLRYSELTNYGWGYFTGYVIFLALFAVLMYFSGKRIIKSLN